MVTQELLSFVNESLKAGKNINDIQLELVTSGWQAEDIQEALRQVVGQSSPQSNFINPNNFLHIFNNFSSNIRNIKFLVPILIILVLTIGFIFIFNSNKKSTNKSELKSQQESQSKLQVSPAQSGFGSLIKPESKQKILADSQSGYRIFEQKGLKKESKLTLLDPNGKVVKTIGTKYPLSLSASFKSMWLLKSDKYWLLDKDGSLNPVSEDINKALISGTGINSENSQTKRFIRYQKTKSCIKQPTILIPMQCAKFFVLI